MRGALRQGQRRLVVEAGWRPGSDLEDRVSWLLHRTGWTLDEVKQEHHLGRYRVDFAFIGPMIALEVDGWHHRSPDGAARDARKDAELRRLGWVVLRVDDQNGEECFLDQVARTLAVIRCVQGKR